MAHIPSLKLQEANQLRLQKLLQEICKHMTSHLAEVRKSLIPVGLFDTPIPHEEGQPDEFLQRFEQLFQITLDSFGKNFQEKDLLEACLMFILMQLLGKEKPGVKENILGNHFQKLISFFFQKENFPELNSQLQDLKVIFAENDFHQLSIDQKYHWLSQNTQMYFGEKITFTIDQNSLQYVLESADYLWEKHFNQKISHKDLHILLPFGANASFLKTLFNYFPKNRLQQKYTHEIHIFEQDLLRYFQNKQVFEEISQEEFSSTIPFQQIFWTNPLRWDTRFGLQKGLFKGQDAYSKRLYQSTQQTTALLLADLRNLPAKTSVYSDLDARIKQAFLKQNPSATFQKSLLNPLSRSLRWIQEKLQSKGLAAIWVKQDLLDKPVYQWLRKEFEQSFNQIYLFHHQEDVLILMLKSLEVSQAEVFYIDKSFSEAKKLFEEIDFTQLDTQASGSWLPKKSAVINLKVFANSAESIFIKAYSGIKAPTQHWPIETPNKLLAKKVNTLLKAKTNSKNKKNKVTHNGQIALLAPPQSPTPVKAKKSFEPRRQMVFSEAPFTQKWIYWHAQSTYQKHYFLGENPPQKIFPVILLGKSAKSAFPAVFFSGNIPGQRFFPALKVFPLMFAANDDQYTFNISDFTLKKFKDHYETPMQEKANLHHEYLNQLLDFSEFENCQVDPELAQELRKLIQLGENTALTDHLYKYINHPQDKTEGIFRKFAQEFQKIKKTFGRIGKRSCRSKESYDILQIYFDQGAKGVDAIQDFYFDDKNRLDLQFGLENEIQKEDIFYYIYAILHDEKFLSTFAGLDSKTQFPVVPFYGNFWQWVDWGRILAKTHQNYNKLHPYPLIKEENSIRRKPTEKPKVKIFEEESEIILSYQYKVVRFFGFPKDVWSYKPGGKSMIQIALDNLKSLRIIMKLLCRKRQICITNISINCWILVNLKTARLTLNWLKNFVSSSN